MSDWVGVGCLFEVLAGRWFWERRPFEVLAGLWFGNAVRLKDFDGLCVKIFGRAM